MKIQDFQKTSKQKFMDKVFTVRPDKECEKLFDDFAKAIGKKPNLSLFVREAIKIGGPQILKQIKK